MFRALHFTQVKRLSFAAGLLFAFTGLLGGAFVATGKVDAAKALCNSNVIMYCGFTSPSNFISKVKTNDSGNGHNDLQAIYSHYGLSSADYTRFANDAVSGTIYRDGRITVGNTTVVTDGQNLGREKATQGSGAYAVNIGSTTYWANANSRTYRPDQDALPAHILLDSMGQFQVGVVDVCGNPVWGTTVKNTASCKMLNQTAVPGKANTYDFTATANVGGNAKITKYVYSFGDGSASVTTTDGTKAVRHAYTKDGNYTAKVTVFASVPGNSNLQLPVVATCSKVITVKTPFYSCVQLTGAILDKAKFRYSFTATANYGNDTTFTSADFDFGDGTTLKGVKASGASVMTEHTYAKAGKYSIKAILNFNAGGVAVTAPTCSAMITPTTPPTPECKPGVPVGSAECTPCEYDSSLPSDSPKCAPQVLPDTGAGNTIAIFTALAVGGFLIYRQLLFRRHKAAFAAAERGTSPLPLSHDPLNDDAPLQGTPYERPAVQSKLRRRRPF